MNDIAYRNTNKEKIDYVVTDPVTMPDDGGNIPITFYYDACKASVDTEFVLYAIALYFKNQIDTLLFWSYFSFLQC